MGRDRFFFNLGALGAAVLLIIASVAFGSAVKGVGLGIGVVCCVLSLGFVGVLTHRRRYTGYRELRMLGRRVGLWSLLAGAMAGVAAWECVQSGVFETSVSRWLTLANGLLLAILGCAGLVMHEISTERVVYVLEVVQRPERDG
jgi:hypothetical protein